MIFFRVKPGFNLLLQYWASFRVVLLLSLRSCRAVRFVMQVFPNYPTPYRE